MRPLLTHWSTEHGHPAKLLFRKVAIFNVTMTLMMHAIHHYILAADADQSEAGHVVCVQPLSVTWLVMTVSGLTLVTACFRFLAMLLPHSKVIMGYTVYSPPQDITQPGFSKLTSGFSKVIGLFLLLGVIVITGIGFLVMRFLPSHPDVTAELEVCAVVPPEGMEGRVQKVLWFVLLILLPAITAIALEHIYYCFSFRKLVGTEVPGFDLILSSPFVITLCVTMWSGWLITMTLTFVAHGSGPELQTCYWKYFVALDSLWMLLLFLLATYRYRLTT